MFRRLLSLVALALASLDASCAASSEPSTLAEERAAIYGGTESGTEDDASLFLRSAERACTGVLVAPNLVVTVLHCLSRGQALSFQCSAEGELENDGSGAGEIGDPFEPSSIRVFSGPVPGKEPIALGARVLGTGSTNVCRNDLAFLVLDRNLDLPMKTVDLSRRARLNETVTIVGYGSTELGEEQIQRRRREGVRIIDLHVPPHTFTVTTGACLGDSGGPALSSADGALLGVNSLLSGPCGASASSGTYTELAEFAPLAREAFRVAGAEQWLGPAPKSKFDPACAMKAGAVSSNTWLCLFALCAWCGVRARARDSVHQPRAARRTRAAHSR